MSPAATLVDDARIGIDYDPNHVPAKLDFKKFKLNDWYFRTAKFINTFEVARAFHGPVMALYGSDHGLHQNREEVYTRVVDFLTK